MQYDDNKRLIHRMTSWLAVCSFFFYVYCVLPLIWTGEDEEVDDDNPPRDEISRHMSAVNYQLLSGNLLPLRGIIHFIFDMAVHEAERKFDDYGLEFMNALAGMANRKAKVFRYFVTYVTFELVTPMFCISQFQMCYSMLKSSPYRSANHFPFVVWALVLLAERSISKALLKISWGFVHFSKCLVLWIEDSYVQNREFDVIIECQHLVGFINRHP